MEGNYRIPRPRSRIERNSTQRLDTSNTRTRPRDSHDDRRGEYFLPLATRRGRDDSDRRRCGPRSRQPDDRRDIRDPGGPAANALQEVPQITALQSYVGDIKAGYGLEPTCIVMQSPLQVRADLRQLHELPIQSASGVAAPLRGTRALRATAGGFHYLREGPRTNGSRRADRSCHSSYPPAFNYSSGWRLGSTQPGRG